MKFFRKMIKKVGPEILLVVAIVAVIVGVRAGGLIAPVTAQSSASAPVTGYAWSDTIGWIDLHCINSASALGCGWGVDTQANGDLTGYAWSDNIGWVQFGGLSGFPSGSGTTAANAHYDSSANTITGWIKAVAGGSPESGGWDGWISLNGSNYGITINPNTGAATGFGWGSLVVGWVDFSARPPAGTTTTNGPSPFCTQNPSHALCDFCLQNPGMCIIPPNNLEISLAANPVLAEESAPGVGDFKTDLDYWTPNASDFDQCEVFAVQTASQGIAGIQTGPAVNIPAWGSSAITLSGTDVPDMSGAVSTLVDVDVPRNPTFFVIECFDAQGGSAEDFVQVNWKTTSPSISISRGACLSSTSAEIVIFSQNVTSCTATDDQGNTLSVPANGSVSVQAGLPVTVTASCQSSSGTVSDTLALSGGACRGIPPGKPGNPIFEEI